MIRVLLLLTGLLLTSEPQDVQLFNLNAIPNFSADEIEFFEKEIRPVLVQHCYECHSTDAAELKAGLFVDSREGLIKGGESGTAMIPGKPADSLLVASIKYEANEMPPDRKLEQRQIDAMTKWIEMGAPWPKVTSSTSHEPSSTKDWRQFDWKAAQQSHWAWKPVQRPSVPVVDAEMDANPIDRFVEARRQHAARGPVALAEAPILARRIYLDLIGVLPTLEETLAFSKSASTDRQKAVESLVGKLLDTTMYGQRWARHWLDVARFSEGQGGFLDNVELKEAWRYRDWVVDALNQDLPINDFIRLQIAGDLSGNPSDAIATGFFALGPTYQSDGGDPDSVAQSQGETLDDRIDLLTRGLLGITGSCARCHDHKFDPIPQADYYSLAGVFMNTSMQALPLDSSDVVKNFSENKEAIESLSKRINPLTKKIKKENREATAEERIQLDEWTAKLEELKKNPKSNLNVAHTLHDTGSEDMKVALRGNLRKTGDIAPRQFLRLLVGENPIRFTKGSGREELAAAIVEPRNPLTARVFVNRVWMHHFGAGLVRTPSNFGSLGESPTHPELLDWLTCEFIDGGWSLKSLHKRIMTSATYQRSSTFEEQSFKIDSDNRWLWRMNPRRMDVEIWRDSLLSVTGDLDASLTGPSFNKVTESKRRTLYAKVSRNGDVFESDSFLRRFDFPLMRATVEQRPNSIVPQQFLFLMNSDFMVQRAKSLVARIQSYSPSDEARIRQAYELLYSRSPETVELKMGLAFLNATKDGQELSSWDRFAQVLLSSNEFMYIR